MTVRRIRFTDRIGASTHDAVTLDHLEVLLDAIATPDGDFDALRRRPWRS